MRGSVQSERPLLRPATRGDAQPAAGLWTEAYVTLGVGGRADPYTGRDFGDSTRHGEVFVAEQDGELLGVVVLLPPGSPISAVARAAEAELSRLAVAASARRRGIGRSLAELCEHRARQAGWPAIALWSRPGQREAHRLYRSLGYARASERDSVDDTGHPRWVFLKRLTDRE